MAGHAAAGQEPIGKPDSEIPPAQIPPAQIEFDGQRRSRPNGPSAFHAHPTIALLAVGGDSLQRPSANLIRWPVPRGRAESVRKARLQGSPRRQASSADRLPSDLGNHVGRSFRAEPGAEGIPVVVPAGAWEASGKPVLITQQAAHGRAVSAGNWRLPGCLRLPASFADRLRSDLGNHETGCQWMGPPLGPLGSLGLPQGPLQGFPEVFPREQPIGSLLNQAASFLGCALCESSQPRRRQGY